LGNNLIEWIEPGAFRYLSALKKLHLQKNSLPRVTCGNISWLDQLEELDLKSNKLVQIDSTLDSVFYADAKEPGLGH
jgi:Leucine-rich repeat (LRR) protein